ncbi:MAG: LysM peptidoglycan-binding domain-containing protein [Candidatus Omnitrophota bacterium]
MKVRSILSVLILVSAFMLSGCVVRTYEVTRDRVDQDLSMGNRGYLMGQAPAGESGLKEKRMTRQTRVVEIELGSPIKFERLKKQKSAQVEEVIIEETMVDYPADEEAVPSRMQKGNFQKYTVQKGDTLQKISQKFFGTTKKWPKIYDANSEALKGPNKIYVGQTLNIPVDAMKEPRENLK